MITALDDQVGRIVAALEKKNMRDNTLIVFSSDNGGATSALFATGARSEAERKAEGLGPGAKPPASNGAFRGGKGSLHEGGVRVPAIVNWPAGSTPAIIREPLHMVDLMPTFSLWPAPAAAAIVPSTARTSGRRSRRAGPRRTRTS